MRLPENTDPERDYIDEKYNRNKYLADYMSSVQVIIKSHNHNLDESDAIAINFRIYIPNSNEEIDQVLVLHPMAIPIMIEHMTTILNQINKGIK